VPGCYGRVTVRQAAHLVLNAGQFRIRELIVRKRGEILTQGGAVDVNVRTRILTEEDTNLQASSGNPDDLQFWIGSDGKASTSIGKFSQVFGTLFAPNDTSFDFKRNVTLIGSALAR